MIWALNRNGKAVRAKPGISTFCPNCKEMLIPKCGNLRIWHFAHPAEKDCERWGEPETPWHLWWKSKLPVNRCEVRITFDETTHITDGIANNGYAVEFQHSGINAETVAERTAFYTQATGGCMWVVDALSFKAQVELVLDAPFVVRKTFGELRSDERYFRWLHPRQVWENATALHLDFGVDGMLEVYDWKRLGVRGKYWNPFEGELKESVQEQFWGKGILRYSHQFESLFFTESPRPL